MVGVYAVSGTIKHLVAQFEDYDEAFDFCEACNWLYDWNGGIFWDLEIELGIEED